MTPPGRQSHERQALAQQSLRGQEGRSCFPPHWALERRVCRGETPAPWRQGPSSLHPAPSFLSPCSLLLLLSLLNWAAVSILSISQDGLWRKQALSACTLSPPASFPLPALPFSSLPQGRQGMQEGHVKSLHTLRLETRVMGLAR